MKANPVNSSIMTLCVYGEDKIKYYLHSLRDKISNERRKEKGRVSEGEQRDKQEPQKTGYTYTCSTCICVYTVHVVHVVHVYVYIHVHVLNTITLQVN